MGEMPQQPPHPSLGPPAAPGAVVAAAAAARQNLHLRRPQGFVAAHFTRDAAAAAAADAAALQGRRPHTALKVNLLSTAAAAAAAAGVTQPCKGKPSLLLLSPKGLRSLP